MRSKYISDEAGFTQPAQPQACALSATPSSSNGWQRESRTNQLLYWFQLLPMKRLILPLERGEWTALGGIEGFRSARQLAILWTLSWAQVAKVLDQQAAEHLGGAWHLVREKVGSAIHCSPDQPQHSALVHLSVHPSIHPNIHPSTSFIT